MLKRVSVFFTVHVHAANLPGVVDDVDDRIGRIRDQVLDDVAVTVLAAVMQRRLAGGIDGQQRVALRVQLLQLRTHTCTIALHTVPLRASASSHTYQHQIAGLRRLDDGIRGFLQQIAARWFFSAAPRKWKHTLCMSVADE